MNFFHFAYNYITFGAALVAVPSLWIHHRLRGDDLEPFRQRLGIYPESFCKSIGGRPRVWLHAVSVGEVGVAMAISKALHQKMPSCRLVLSTTTSQGFSKAVSDFGDLAACFYTPLDLRRPDFDRCLTI